MSGEGISDMAHDRVIPCPVCDSTEYETIYKNALSEEVIGCDCCVQTVDGWEYNEREREAAYDSTIDMLIDEAIDKRVFGCV